jgi:hypothetical protein
VSAFLTLLPPSPSLPVRLAGPLDIIFETGLVSSHILSIVCRYQTGVV